MRRRLGSCHGRKEQPPIQLALLCSTRSALAWNVVVDDVDVDGAAGVDLLVGVDVEPALVAVAREVDGLGLGAGLGDGVDEEGVAHQVLTLHREGVGVLGELVPH